MEFLQWLKSRWQSEAVHYTYFWIPRENVTMPAGQTLPTDPVKSGQHYIRLWLAEMFLKNDRDWASAWYPAALSTVVLKFGDKTQQIAHVAGETTLQNFDLTKLNRGVAVNHQITTLLPFNGGDIQLEAALLAMQGKSDLKSLLKVLGDFSKLLVVPQLSAAISVADKLADGLSELVGATNAKPELRIQDAWTGAGVQGGNPLRAGYFVSISAVAGEIRPQELFVRNSQLYRGDKPMTGYHYMLFRLDVSDKRDDWDSLSSISDPYKQAIDMLESATKMDDPETRGKLRAEAEKRFAAARFAAFRAPELTAVVGKNQVLEELDQRWKEAKKQLVGEGAFREDFPRSLSDIMRRPRLSAADALERGEPREEDLWQGLE
jgi:hypothetical protein